MKNFKFTLFILIFFSANVHSQITITPLNQIPAIDDSVHYYNDTSLNFDPDGTGPDSAKVWDMSSANVTSSSTYFVYDDPSTIPVSLGSNYFPASTIARRESGVNGYFYFQTTANDINRLGWYIDSTQYGIYSNSYATEFHFPMTFGQNSTTYYHGLFAPLNAGEDSVIISNGSLSIFSAMQGEFLLGDCRIDSVLCYYVSEVFTIEMCFGGFCSPLETVTDEYYYYFVDSLKFPLAIHGTTSTATAGVTNTVTRYQDFSPCIPSYIDNFTKDTWNLFPNPTQNILNIEAPAAGNCEVSIFNILGQYQQGVTLNSRITGIDVSDLPGGVYLLSIYMDDSTIIRRFVKE